MIKTALTARAEIIGGSEPNAKGILDKIEPAINEDTSEAELEFVAATRGMLGEYKKALPLWQRLPLATPANPKASYILCRGMRV